MSSERGSGGTERLWGLIAKWREDAACPISKKAHEIDREVMEAVKRETLTCARELEAALADSPRAMYRYAGELQPQPYEPESAAPAPSLGPSWAERWGLTDGPALERRIKELERTLAEMPPAGQGAQREPSLEQIAQLMDDAECLPTCDSVTHDELCPYVNPGNAIRAMARREPSVREAADRLLNEVSIHKSLDPEFTTQFCADIELVARAALARESQQKDNFPKQKS
jgi:hypothetical protein